MLFWRVCRKARAATTFDGEGARRYPGRWNPAEHVPVVYCSSSLSLATLEYFVHVDPDDIPDDLVAIRAELPDAVAVERVEASALPKDWRRYPGPVALKDRGSAWAASGRSVALLVPSAVTPIENNIVLNPRHPDIAALAHGKPGPFEFDRRMWR